jgi:hypothetical protein
MHLDVRLPVGFLFSFLGSALTAYGLFGDRKIYRVSLGINVNLGWGIVLLIFGALMLFFGWKRQRTVPQRDTLGEKAADRPRRSGNS